MEDGKEMLQWHPAFYAALQVELEEENGIYYVKGSLVPIQIIVLSQLSAEKNLWFRVLTDKLRDRKIASGMLAEAWVLKWVCHALSWFDAKNEEVKVNSNF